MKPNITEQEEQLVIDYIYKTYLIELLEGDLKAIPDLNFKISEPYENLIEDTLKKLRKDVKKINEEFTKVNGKVEGPELVNVEFFKYDYFIRGYHGVHRIFTYHFRNTATKLLEGYLKR